MFNKATPEDVKINTKAYIKVYYEYIQGKFRLYERESFFDFWRVVDEYKTLEEAQESARSRAIKVDEMGLFENGHRKGMMSWWEEPKPLARVIPGTSANFDESDEIKFERLPKNKKKPEVLSPEEKPVTNLSAKSTFSLQK